MILELQKLLMPHSSLIHFRKISFVNLLRISYGYPRKEEHAAKSIISFDFPLLHFPYEKALLCKFEEKEGSLFHSTYIVVYSLF